MAALSAESNGAGGSIRAHMSTDIIPPRHGCEWGPKEDIQDLRYDLNIVNGVPTNPDMTQDAINNLIETFETRDDDVFVVTYVKSGTTWTQQILHLLRNGGEQGDKAYMETCPWLEAAMAGGMVGSWEATGSTVESIAAIPRTERRFLKSHANVKDLPRGKAKGVKVIYVARNPKDVCVSLHYHATQKPCFGYTGTFGNMLHLFMEGRCENGSWFNHVLEWHDEHVKDPEHVLFLQYETMLDDREAAVRTIADFVGLEASDELVDKVLKASSIETMKQHQKTNIGFNHLRKGGSGGWRNYFTVMDSDRFDEVYKQHMEGSGLVFDFGNGLKM